MLIQVFLTDCLKHLERFQNTNKQQIFTKIKIPSLKNKAKILGGLKNLRKTNTKSLNNDN